MFLGIDLGTSSLKAVLTDTGGIPIAEASVPLRTSSPHPGWSEQDPEDWWTAFRQAMALLRERQPVALRAVRALGLSGQMHGAVLVDASGAPIRPAILWNDGRATRECEALIDAVPDLPRIAGAVPMPGFTAPKLLWLRRHEPEAFKRMRKVVPPKDFLRLRLTGEAITDMADASGTLWLDQRARDWSDAILASSGLDRTHVPELAEGSAQAGSIRAALLDELGIDRPVVLAGGAGDVAAAAVGIGAIAAGDAFVSLGTSAQFFVADDTYRPQPQSFLHAFAHALPARWFRMAAMLNGASCLDWIARIVGESDIGRLLDRTEASFAGPSRVLFLPYLSGERTPHNDPSARGAFIGLDPTATATDLTQAVLEGVAFSLLEAKRLLESAGVGLEAVAAVGGGARSRFWMRLHAHILGLPVVRYAAGDNSAALGAARLARLALTGERAEAVCTKPPVLEVSEPDPVLTAAYAERLDCYRRLYPAVKPAVGGPRVPLP